jgi:uncharacterized membrane protein
MGKGRLEAFSDGVIAIIITIMVLELHVPEGEDLAALGPVLPVLGSYLMSFVFLGIYWNNHHHMFQACRQVSGSVLWANLHLLFWLSLTPVTTAWMGESGFAAWPVAIYGVVLLFSAVAYYILTRTLLAVHDRESAFARALGSDFKGRASLVAYLVAVPLAFVHPALAWGTYVAVAIWWLVPDRRFERVLPSAHAERERAGV